MRTRDATYYVPISDTKDTSRRNTVTRSRAEKPSELIALKRNEKGRHRQDARTRTCGRVARTPRLDVPCARVYTCRGSV
jgi:hypothetical protein